MSNWKIYTGMKKLVLFTLILFSLSAMKIHSTELPREAKDIYLKKTQGNIQPPVVSLNELLSEPNLKLKISSSAGDTAELAHKQP